VKNLPNALYLLEDSDNTDDLVLHMPVSPGSLTTACGYIYTEEDIYLPDPDQAIADFCSSCAEFWIEAKTTNVLNNWRAT
jgi:hypothetical protein